MAAPAAPPACRTLVAANCAPPAKTIADMMLPARGPDDRLGEDAEGHAEHDGRHQQRQGGAQPVAERVGWRLLHAMAGR